MIPIFMRMKIKEKGKKGFRLFIPIILIWILLFALLIILLPIFLIAAILTIPAGIGFKILFFYPLLFSLLCSLSGLAVHIENPEKQFLIVFK